MKDFEKGNLSGINHEGASPNIPLQLLTASSIIGDKVKDPKGNLVGSVKDLMIHVPTGSIAYVVIELGGFLGIGEKYFAFAFASLTVDTTDESFVLDQDFEAIRHAPGFDKGHWPGTNTRDFDTSPGGLTGASLGSDPKNN